MTTREFLMAFRRSISQKGSPDIMISDNALQFKAANKTLENVLRNVVHSEDVQNYAANAKIKWNFIVEVSPWMGGYYERLVGLVKRTLRKTIGCTLVTNMQMQTFLKETEAVLNSRPLVYVEEDIDSCIAITPGHFLSLNRNLGLPETVKRNKSDEEYLPFESSGKEILKLWKKGHRLLDFFWQLRRNEYLLSLRERTQSELKSGKVQSAETPFIGEVVLIKEDLPRGCWKYGKIIDLPKSFDGKIRSAKVMVSSGRIVNRPLNLLFPLETAPNTNKSTAGIETPTGHDNLQSLNSSARKSERNAAKTARDKIKQIFDN
ncbi:uncharacterized protein LOC128554915 [Mercenaria mercenaria]|uniref:uncharacterized protein LOC128554915 n=1 Tax=Mercenaria mercenaria TaxID=6596 RepID=UPI00234E53FD|nr:uncharacterized protein LOC128554915 [Mercenaria mercenaria]